MDEFTAKRKARGDCCPVCAEVDCPGQGLLLACQRLWGNPDISGMSYAISADGTQTISVEFDRSMVEVEFEPDPEAA